MMLQHAHGRRKLILIPNPRDMPAVLKELSKHKFHSFPAVNTLFNGAGQPRRLRHRRLEQPRRSRSAAAWRCRARSPSCGSRRPAARSARATACRRPRRRPPATRSTSTAYTGTIGLPMPNTELKLLDDDGNEVPLGTAGRDRDQGPAGDGRLLAAPRRDRQGDDGRRLLPHRRHRRGRRARLLQDRRPQEGHDPGRGFNVYPNEVEDVVTQMPGVLECAAVGVPDEKAGEAVKLVIVKQGPGAHRSRRCAPTARPTSPATSGRRSSSSAPSCRRRRSARSCAANCATRSSGQRHGGAASRSSPPCRKSWARCSRRCPTSSACASPAAISGSAICTVSRSWRCCRASARSRRRPRPPCCSSVSASRAIVFTGVAGGLGARRAGAATWWWRPAAAARPGCLADLSAVRGAADRPCALRGRHRDQRCAGRRGRRAAARSGRAAGRRRWSTTSACRRRGAPRPGGERRPLRLDRGRKRALRRGAARRAGGRDGGRRGGAGVPRLRRALRRGAHDLRPRRRCGAWRLHCASSPRSRAATASR